ncbi:MAG TPA: hypothetical protein VG095_10350, partial [Chthoniobacterales bacterium]|nr:hypothetical protein [Chthoniobacterales bacterium]
MRRVRLSTLRVIVLLLLAGFFIAIILRWISLERWRWKLLHTEASSVEITEATPTPEPTAPRQRVLSGRFDTARLFNGITVRPVVEPTPGRA